jgi:alpha-N-arabinofuranosidase
VGPGTADTKWTKTVLETCYEDAQRAFHGFMDYITLHHYVFPDGWSNKGSATKYSDELWYKSLNKAVFMDTLIKKNEAVLDDYDPEEKIALCVDEWGGWYEVEEGTNPGFLYQQATMRDALIASATMDIFNRHCKRVKMACIAQMVNVLQSVLLTQGPEMVKTPTFYIFKMYKHHQGATAVDSYITDNEFEGPDEWKIPKVSTSASVKDGVTTLTVSNLSLTDATDVSVDLCGDTVQKILEAKIVTADDVRAFNDFGHDEAITEKEYAGYRFDDGKLSLAMPAHSVVMLRLQ